GPDEMSFTLKPADVPAARPDARRWTALGFIALAQLMAALDATIVGIALPSAQRALAASDAERQWVITAYTLAFGGLLLLGGRIASTAWRHQDVSPALRCPGRRSRHRRTGRAGLCLHPGRVSGVGGAGSDPAAGGKFGAADPVRGSGNAHIRASPSAADRARP